MPSIEFITIDKDASTSTESYDLNEIKDVATVVNKVKYNKLNDVRIMNDNRYAQR